MQIVLNRYYGDRRITKSLLQVVVDGDVVLSCEAREPRFDRYTETFAGCSQSCLAEGEWRCKPMASGWSPMTPTIPKSPGHRSCRFAASDGGDAVQVNMVMVGMSDGNPDPAQRGLTDGTTVFAELVRWMYHAYQQDDTVTVVVQNNV